MTTTKQARTARYNRLKMVALAGWASAIAMVSFAEGMALMPSFPSTNYAFSLTEQAADTTGGVQPAGEQVNSPLKVASSSVVIAALPIAAGSIDERAYSEPGLSDCVASWSHQGRDGEPSSS